MNWYAFVWHWLAYAAISSFALTALTAMALFFCKQPARRLRLIQLGLAGCLLAAPLNRLPGLPQWSVGLLETSEARSTSMHGSKLTATTPAAAASFTGATRIEDHAVERVHQNPYASHERPFPKTDVFGSMNSTSSKAVSSTGETHSQKGYAADEPAETWSFQRWVVTVYLAVAGGLFVWWLIGLVKLQHLAKGAHLAPDDVAAVFRKMFGATTKPIRLLASDHVDAPLTFGWLRPVIVLPSRLCRQGDTPGLRYCLAHEWSHVERKDIGDWYLATIVKFLSFYHPFSCLLRRQLRLCQDYLADARAAAQATAAEDYAEYLVSLAQQRLAAPLPALGFADRKSQLFRRITMLVSHRIPLERHCGRRWNVAITLAAVCLIAAVVAIRLEASKPATSNDETSKQTNVKPVKTKEKESDPKKAKERKDDGKKTPDQSSKKKPAEPITYHGKVTDRISGKPIEGVTVDIWTSLSSDPKTRQKRELRQISVTTNMEGEYSFTLTSEEVSQRSLYIVVDAHHPNYAAKGRSGYGHRMIQKNLKLGSPPFYTNIKLWPGEAIAGVIETPDGKPVEGVEILTYVKHTKSKRFDFGGFNKTRSDQDGKFRITVSTPGEGVLWLTPADHSPSAHYVSKERRGDWGRFVLEKGSRLRGKVLSAKGEPVAGLKVEARRRGDGIEEVDAFLGQNAVANHIGRSATSNEKGEFVLADLPSGTYRIRTRREYNQTRSKPPEHVFVETSITLKEGDMPKPLEIRAAPHIEIHAQFLDSKGKPSGGHQQHLFGRFEGGGFYFTQSNAPKREDGKIVFKAPHGLEGVQISLMNNEHGSMRWRTSPEAPLQRGRRIDLGMVEDDVTGIQIIRYVAPILLVKAMNNKGKLIEDIKVKAVYGGERPKTGVVFANGSDVNFEKQSDGRWRSSQLIPDEEITITPIKEGYTTMAQTVSLKEKTERELVFVLKKDEPAENDVEKVVEDDQE